MTRKRLPRRQETTWLAVVPPEPEPLHFKGGALRRDGAECGALGEAFTGDERRVTCEFCRADALGEVWR